MHLFYDGITKREPKGNSSRREEKEHSMIEIRPIGSLELPALDPYTHLNENQLRHYFEPENGLFIGESHTVIERALDAGYQPLSVLMERKYLETEGTEILRRCRELPELIPVYTAELDTLMEITGYHLTRGILCAFYRRVLPSVEAVCRDASRIAVLENVENPTNVGAIFRSAAAMGMDAVLLTPDCADPLYRRSIRVGVGTVFQVPWTYIGLSEPSGTWTKHKDPEKIRREEGNNPAGWPEEGIRYLHELGFYLTAMALREDTISIADPVLAGQKKLAVVLGNEGDGLLPETIRACDATVKIPMAHGVDSLNVAAASAVAFWELGNANRNQTERG